MSTLRKIAPMDLAGIVVPGGADMPEPVLERARPEALLVDETYQRDLTMRSVVLIHKMVRRWDWGSFQPPLVVRVNGGLHVVDGQHTAIAAASHPLISDIPVLVINAPATKDRALAFIGRNRDRIIVTPTQLHHAAVAAGDEDAMTIDVACRKAGVRILKSPPGLGYYAPGDTLAIGSVGALARRRGAMRTRQVLEICARAKLAPLSANVIKAVEALVCGPEYASVDHGDITTVLRDGAIALERAAAVTAAAARIPTWRALVVAILKKVKGRGR